MFQIQKDVPLVAVKASPGKRTRTKYPFDQMAVGDMFFVPNKPRNTMSAYVWTVGKELDRKFSSRMTSMKQSATGEWQPCDADAPGAVRGIGVWRTK